MSDDAFDALVRHETGEPLLGLRQAALVDALTHRLHNGPPLSGPDRVAVGWLAETVNLQPVVP